MYIGIQVVSDDVTAAARVDRLPQERESILHDWEVQVARRQKDIDEMQTDICKQIEQREKAVNEALTTAEKRLADVECKEMHVRKVVLSSCVADQLTQDNVRAVTTMEERSSQI